MEIVKAIAIHTISTALAILILMFLGQLYFGKKCNCGAGATEVPAGTGQSAEGVRLI